MSVLIQQCVWKLRTHDWIIKWDKETHSKMESNGDFWVGDFWVVLNVEPCSSNSTNHQNNAHSWKEYNKTMTMRAIYQDSPDQCPMLINVDQCRSKFWHWSQCRSIPIDRQWSALRGIADQCHDLHWEALGIDRGSPDICNEKTGSVW